MSEKTEKKGRKETFCRREKQTAPKQGSSSTSGLKIKRKTPVKPMSFTYVARPLTQIMVQDHSHARNRSWRIASPGKAKRLWPCSTG